MIDLITLFYALGRFLVIVLLGMSCFWLWFVHGTTNGRRDLIQYLREHKCMNESAARRKVRIDTICCVGGLILGAATLIAL